ncbi:MAG: M23 family metallopeptidase [Novosphingobium sp.]|nr:M23 family metallopeptidase [Novosphingobium sp.]
MVVFKSIARFRPVAGTIISGLMLAIAGPALANSSASADIAAPLRAAQAARQSVSGAEDEQFGRLFRSWMRFEDASSRSLAAASGSASTASGRFGSVVSIPSRIPVDGMRLTSGFGMRNHPVLGGRRLHKGIDLAAPTGTPILAAADGIVSRADWFSSYGLFVSIEHGGEIQTRYGHMSRLNVAEGQRVRKGDVIGFVGSTGRSTGPHLHYEVRIANEAVDPLPYMQADSAMLASGSSRLDAIGGP